MKNFRQMSSKKLNELLATTNEEDAATIESILMDRKKYIDPTHTADRIQSYKDEFGALYKKMLEEFDVETGLVNISWTAEYNNDGTRTIYPHVLITI